MSAPFPKVPTAQSKTDQPLGGPGLGAEVSPYWHMRRRYVADWHLQVRLTRQFGRFAVSAFVLGCLNVYLVTLLLEYVESQPDGLHSLDGLQQVALVGGIVLLILANGALFFLASIFFSHRLAGPQVKIVTALRELRGKNLGINVTLRQTDFLHEIADGLNDVAREWDEAIRTLRAECQAVRRSTAGLDHPELRESLDAMERTLDGFTTGGAKRSR